VLFNRAKYKNQISKCDTKLKLIQFLHDVMRIKWEPNLEVDSSQISELRDILSNEVFCGPQVGQSDKSAREVKEVTGRNVMLSDVVELLQSFLKGQVTEGKEVRVFATNVIFVDENLTKENFHGTNVVIR